MACLESFTIINANAAPFYKKKSISEDFTKFKINFSLEIKGKVCKEITLEYMNLQQPRCVLSFFVRFNVLSIINNAAHSAFSTHAIMMVVWPFYHCFLAPDCFSNLLISRCFSAQAVTIPLSTLMALLSDIKIIKIMRVVNIYFF